MGDDTRTARQIAARGDLGIFADDDRVFVARTAGATYRGDGHPAVGLTPDDLRWLVTAGGPAALAAITPKPEPVGGQAYRAMLDREHGRNVERGPVDAAPPPGGSSDDGARGTLPIEEQGDG